MNGLESFPQLYFGSGMRLPKGTILPQDYVISKLLFLCYVLSLSIVSVLSISVLVLREVGVRLFSDVFNFVSPLTESYHQRLIDSTGGFDADRVPPRSTQVHVDNCSIRCLLRRRFCFVA